MSRLFLEGVGMTSQRTRDRMVQRLVSQGIRDEMVLQVIRNTPRHWFLDEALSHRAYEDTALPIGYGQTLSQPYVVARMTELLLAHAPIRGNLLEIGTGSGYQTAVLAQFFDRVSSVERIQPLQEKARQRLQSLKLYNVRFKHADGGLGWPERGPFDAILAAAAPSVLPAELLDQLAPGGVMVLPVGEHVQTLTLVKKDLETHKITQQDIEPVRFVPLVPGITR